MAEMSLFFCIFATIFTGEKIKGAVALSYNIIFGSLRASFF